MNEHRFTDYIKFFTFFACFVGIPVIITFFGYNYEKRVNYEKSVKNLSSKIADEIYCNDRSLLTDIDEAKLKKIIMKEIENENINELMVEYGYDDETTFINDYLDFYKDFTLLSLNGLNYNSHFSQYDSLSFICPPCIYSTVFRSYRQFHYGAK